jgi:predicted peroxiredoxin/TusA-related sulfurtransferase
LKTVNIAGVRAPNAALLAEDIIRHMDNPGEGLCLILSPGAEAGMEAVARKHGYSLETAGSGKSFEVRMLPATIKTEEIDVTGDTCPGPVITVGNYLSSAAIGERVRVKSASEEAIDDIENAVKSLGSKVVAKGVDGGRFYLVAEKAEKAPAAAGVIANKDSVLVVQSNGIGNAERAYATFIFSKAALSMGKKVTIFTLMDGVSIARKGNAAGVKHPDFDRLDRLMDEVLKAGAKLYVCELSAKFRGVKKGDLVDGAKLAGAATYIELLSDPAYAVVNF